MTVRNHSNSFRGSEFNSNFHQKFVDPLRIDSAVWENTHIIFDSSALLDLYEYSQEACDSLFQETLSRIKECLWIPQHVEYEYLLNRESTINKTKGKYAEINGNNNGSHITNIQKAVKDIQNNVKSVKERSSNLENINIHPYMDKCVFENFQKELNNFKNAFDNFKDRIDKQVELRYDEIEKIIHEDYVLNNVRKFFKVGRKFSFDEQIHIVEEGEVRFRNKVPPGYMDSILGGISEKNAKKGLQQYGDLIIWKQILEYASQANKDIILVINDVKDDWCYLSQTGSRKSRRIERPREELIAEFSQHSDCKFWMYTLNEFLFQLKSHPDVNVSSKVNQETHAIEERIDADFQKDLLTNNICRSKGHRPVSYADGIYLRFRCERCGQLLASYLNDDIDC